MTDKNYNKKLHGDSVSIFCNALEIKKRFQNISQGDNFDIPYKRKDSRKDKKIQN